MRCRSIRRNACNDELSIATPEDVYPALLFDDEDNGGDRIDATPFGISSGGPISEGASSSEGA